jgi:L-threonylcarbamoyladenylate synthase
MTTRDSARARTNHSDSGLHEVAAVAVRAGKLVVFPTETFYAIGADPMQPCALAAVVQLKGREPDKPIALIASDTDSAFAIARAIPADARLLAERFWPGPLTLVLPAREGFADALIGPNGGIGVRVSSHPTACALARAAGGLVTATSANFSGQPPARTLSEARQSLGTRISVYVDGGALDSDAPSTVIEFSKDSSCWIVRAGLIDPSAITSALGRPR